MTKAEAREAYLTAMRDFMMEQEKTKEVVWRRDVNGYPAQHEREQVARRKYEQAQVDYLACPED